MCNSKSNHIQPIDGGQTCFSHFFAIDSNITIKNVAIGPSSKETKNQAIPLRFFDWASPAFINAGVPHPIAYEDCCVIFASMIIFPSSLLERYIFIFDQFWDDLLHFFKTAVLCHSDTVVSIMIYAPGPNSIQLILYLLVSLTVELAFIVLIAAFTCSGSSGQTSTISARSQGSSAVLILPCFRAVFGFSL